MAKLLSLNTLLHQLNWYSYMNFDHPVSKLMLTMISHAYKVMLTYTIRGQLGTFKWYPIWITTNSL
jgi:hypothetical protein